MSYCYYTLDEIAEHKLLPPERIQYLRSCIESSVKPLVLQDGTTVEGWFVAIHPSKGRHIVYANPSFYEREVLAWHLTESEIALLAKAYWSETWRKSESAKFDKATKIPRDEYDGRVWYNDQAYDDPGEVLQQLIDDGCDEDELPKYLWAVKEVPVITPRHVADIVEGDIEDRGWVDMEVKDLKGVDELQAALDRFVEANKGVVSYHPDYMKAVVL